MMRHQAQLFFTFVRGPPVGSLEVRWGGATPPSATHSAPQAEQLCGFIAARSASMDMPGKPISSPMIASAIAISESLDLDVDLACVAKPSSGSMLRGPRRQSPDSRHRFSLARGSSGRTVGARKIFRRRAGVGGVRRLTLVQWFVKASGRVALARPRRPHPAIKISLARPCPRTASGLVTKRSRSSCRDFEIASRGVKM